MEVRKMEVSLDKIKELPLEELLGMAIKSEIEARKFYESFAEKIDIEPLKGKILWLASEEEKHEKMLRKLYSSMFPGKEVVFPKEHIGPELQPVAKELKGSQDVIDLIHWAMKAEEIAAQFYEKLMDIVEGEEKKRLMKSLSDMERGHYYMLRAEYELLLDWEMYSQMMHIGP
nr:ferritin family protein [Pyrococcus abyssi]